MRVSSSADFELFLTGSMVGAWGERKRTRELGPGNVQSQDAVTAVRQWGNVLTGYCGGKQRFGDTLHFPGPVQVMDRLTRASRFRRCDADGTSLLHNDSVAEWEFDLCHELVLAVSVYRRASDPNGPAPHHTVHRLRLDSEIIAASLSAYCGTGPLRLMELAGAEGTPWKQAGVHGTESPSPLRDIVRAGRPVW